MALALVGGAGLGAVFGELLRAVLELKDKAVMFKPTMEELEATLESLDPVVKEIIQHNNELNRPEREIERLMRVMEEGKELVLKCSRIKRWDYVRKIRYQKEMAALDKSLVRFLKVDMQAQIARDQRRTLLAVNSIFMTLRGPAFVQTIHSIDNDVAPPAAPSLFPSSSDLSNRSLTSFFPSSLDFDLSKIISLSVKGCNLFKMLFTPETLAKFSSLEHLEVRYCEFMEEIFSVDSGEEESGSHSDRVIYLPKLVSLRLNSLPNLNFVCKGIMICPCLESLEIISCEKLKLLPQIQPPLRTKIRMYSHTNACMIMND